MVPKRATHNIIQASLTWKKTIFPLEITLNSLISGDE
jgi:hypothetical protein